MTNPTTPLLDAYRAVLAHWRLHNDVDVVPIAPELLTAVANHYQRTGRTMPTAEEWLAWDESQRLNDTEAFATALANHHAIRQDLVYLAMPHLLALAVAADLTTDVEPVDVHAPNHATAPPCIRTVVEVAIPGEPVVSHPTHDDPNRDRVRVDEDGHLWVTGPDTTTVAVYAPDRWSSAEVRKPAAPQHGPVDGATLEFTR